MSQIDEISPEYVGAASIKLALATNDVPRAFNAVDITVAIHSNATIARKVGLSPPLEMTVTAPSASGFVRHVFYNTVPSSFTFTPREGGQHLVRLREVGHNRWHGELVVDVKGERLSAQ